jgi:hypothetical protein
VGKARYVPNQLHSKQYYTSKMKPIKTVNLSGGGKEE